jgi:hypothetical protein
MDRILRLFDKYCTIFEMRSELELAVNVCRGSRQLTFLYLPLATIVEEKERREES